jgi:predicted dithiol-disulfide oxidoreductase (DUF899 family)
MASRKSMELPKIASREEWLAARLELLAKEKELSRAQAALAAERRKLPMVPIEKDYAFTGPHGPARLADLFEGRTQLIIYHFMWLHPVDAGCPSCSFVADNMPDSVHLNKGADTTLALVSRAPLESIERFRTRMGWRLPWYSSAGSDFNYDFHVSFNEAIAPIEYNYKDRQTLQQEGQPQGTAPADSDAHGVSVFVRDGDRVYHTYSAYAAGADVILSTYRFLDMTPSGRQRYVTEWPWHDTYDDATPVTLATITGAPSPPS